MHQIYVLLHVGLQKWDDTCTTQSSLQSPNWSCALLSSWIILYSSNFWLRLWQLLPFTGY